MANLHLRDVPDETLGRLRDIAKTRRTSMNAVAVAELIAGVREEANAMLLVGLPDLGVAQASIVEAVHGGRDEHR